MNCEGLRACTHFFVESVGKRDSAALRFDVGRAGAGKKLTVDCGVRSGCLRSDLGCLFEALSASPSGRYVVIRVCR